MLAAGVVAEYNPFHNGHKYQLEEARRMGATHIVCIMSGASVQRGDIAVFSKYERAETAVRNGADLVIELPCPYSCSNGEVFAKAAVSLLAGLGENVIQRISFGCEDSDIDLLIKAAEISEELESSQEVKMLVSQGLTYPQAVSRAAEKIFGETYAKIFSTPNNVLAVEYIKAAKKSAPWILPMPVKRIFTDHDSSEFCGNTASASYIRDLIGRGEDYSQFVPELFSGDPSEFISGEKAALYKIMTASKEELMQLPDVGENLANRFISVRNHGFRSVSEFAGMLKSRNITLARVRRLILHLILGVTKEDIAPVPYGRILALGERGRDILAAGDKTLTFGTSLKKLEDTSAFAARISKLEQNAVIFQEICRKNPGGFSNEYTRKIQILT